jgi:hypothetical protein
MRVHTYKLVGFGSFGTKRLLRAGQPRRGRTFYLLLSPTPTPTQMSFSSPPKAQLGRLSAFWTCHTYRIQLSCSLQAGSQNEFEILPLSAKIYSTLKMPLICSGRIVRLIRKESEHRKRLLLFVSRFPLC